MSAIPDPAIPHQPAGAARDEVLLSWGSPELTLHMAGPPDGPMVLRGLTGQGETAPEAAAKTLLPVVELVLRGEGRSGTAGKRHVDGVAAARLRLRDHRAEGPGPDGVRRLWLDLVDPASELAVRVSFEVAAGVPVLRTGVELVAGPKPVAVEYVSSFVLAGLTGGRDWEEFAVWRAANPWSGEFRWAPASPAELGLVDVDMVRFGQVGSKNRIAGTGLGAWPSSEQLPMALLEHRPSGWLLGWLIEHNGPWHWEIGDRYGDLYLAVSGPTEQEHQCTVELAPGERFAAVPVSVVLVPAGGADPLAAAAEAMTAHRRRTRRSHVDHQRLPVVYNDFLNALMSDPTTERELPLIEAAAALGAEVFCIDAGWYDEARDGWWDSVGEWEPSASRFPGGGLGALVERIRAAGMTPGLWLEPEVVGVRSTLAARLPAEAFFTRGGQRVTEWGRHQLDLRHPAATAHLDAVVDRLVADFGLGYLKLDYNIDIGAGTDLTGSAGAGLLAHQRAFLDWVHGVMNRHPGLVLEGCAAGGSRIDGATTAVFPILSLTDQQDFRKIPAIAAAAPLAVTPEQSGVWVSVDAAMDDEGLAYSVIGGLLARIHLAGRIDTLDPRQRAVVAEGLACYRSVRAGIPASVPSWPLGLPGWRDGWLAQAARHGEDLLLAVWRRDGEPACRVPLAADAPTGPVEVCYPTWGGETVRRTVGAVEVELPQPYSARLLRISGTARS